MGCTDRNREGSDVSGKQHRQDYTRFGGEFKDYVFYFNLEENFKKFNIRVTCSDFPF
jgi:hypothetical protein